MRFQEHCTFYFVTLSLFITSTIGARFRADPYKFKNFYYRKSALNKAAHLAVDEILEAHPTDPNIMQKAKSLEKFLFEMPDPSVNGGYRQMLREQRKQGEAMDVRMKKTRDQLRERALRKIYDKGGLIPDEEGKLLKQILECRDGAVKPKLTKN